MSRSLCSLLSYFETTRLALLTDIAATLDTPNCLGCAWRSLRHFLRLAQTLVEARESYTDTHCAPNDA
jgi:hypothetical protein